MHDGIASGNVLSSAIIQGNVDIVTGVAPVVDEGRWNTLRVADGLIAAQVPVKGDGVVIVNKPSIVIVLHHEVRDLHWRVKGGGDAHLHASLIAVVKRKVRAPGVALHDVRASLVNHHAPLIVPFKRDSLRSSSSTKKGEYSRSPH